MDIAKLEGHLAAARVEFERAPSFIREKLAPVVTVLEILAHEMINQQTKGAGNEGE